MNIKTKLHYFQFDMSEATQEAAYRELFESTLKNIGFPVWTMHLEHGYTANPDGWKFVDKIRAVVGIDDKRSVKGLQSEAVIELETDYLFDNQWNSVPIPDVSEKGLRLFNWAECRYANRKIKEGYWLEQTAEMRILRNTNTCGFCGKQEPAQKGYVFCPHCIDSEYLKASDLYLTRMVPVSDTNKPRAPLSEAESQHLLPLYRETQKHGASERGKKRLVMARRNIETDYAKSVADAKEKRDAGIWIMDNVPGLLDNWIYYPHANKHCFGWRSPLDSEELGMLLGVISEFPFAYEILCSDGRKLEGY